VVAVAAVAGVIVTPKLLGPTDPGCKSYTGTALTAYNNTIDDLNVQASQAKLTTDMNTAIAELQTAAGQAQSASAKTALNGLLTELTAVRTDVQSGSVPSATVSQLNAAARKADNAC
jgi:maltooligosyltrehalose synthase